MATINGSSSKNNYDFYVSIWETLPSDYVSTNKSTVHYEIYLKNHGTRTNSGGWSFNASYDGISVYSSQNNQVITNDVSADGGYKKLFEGSFDVKHNSAGDKTINFSASISKSSYTQWDPGYCSLNGNFQLTTIPRASTPSAANTDIGSTVRINTNRASGSFTHTITVSFGNFTKTWSNVGAYVDWNTATDENTLYSKIPNSKNGTCTISCTTYNGSSNLGTKTATFKLTANETINKPTITADAVDTNKTLATGNTIQDITGDTTNKTIIKYLSNVAITTTSTPKNYATLASVKVQSGDGTFATSSQDFTATFTDVETTSYSASATDSRGYTGTTDIVDLTMLDYTRLSISPVRLYKTNQTANDLYAEIDGNYFNGNFNNTANVLTLSYKYKESGSSTWSSWVSLTPTISQSEDKYTFDGLIGTNFDYQKIYDFVFKVEDLAMVQTIEAQSVPGIPIIGIFEDFVEMWGEVFVYKD